MALERWLHSSSAVDDARRPQSPLWARTFRVPESVLPVAVIGMAAALRFSWLSRHSLWSDEAFVAWVIRLGWRDMFTFVAQADAHPPLFYAVIKAWAAIAGTGEAALRTLPACFSSLSVLLTYALARRLASPRVGLLAAFLLAASPFDIMAAQEARMYPLLSVLAVGSSLALVVSAERGSPVRWGLYVLLATMMVYTHYLGLLVLLGHGIWIAALERRAAAAWLASMLAATLLYAPWFTALFTQAMHAGQLTRSPNGVVPYLTADALLALFAFGGSLFGSATYFGQGRSSGAEPLLVLLPFIALLWRGVASLQTQPRALGLVGLPLLVTIGVAAPISVSKPLFYPRVFSFLVPFYAVLLAQGTAATAEAAGRYRRLALAGLVAMVLACGTPVLARYYFDPSARPYHWRAAAEWVAGEAAPGDYVLFVGKAAEDSLTYYYRPQTPWRTLQLRRDPRPTFTSDTARQLAQHYRRLWLVLSTPFGPTNAAVQRQLLPALSGAFRVTAGREFNQVWIYLLEPSERRAR